MCIEKRVEREPGRIVALLTDTQTKFITVHDSYTAQNSITQAHYSYSTRFDHTAHDFTILLEFYVSVKPAHAASAHNKSVLIRDENCIN